MTWDCRANTNGYNDLAAYTYRRTLKASNRLGGADKEFTVSLYSKMALLYKKLGDHNEALECLIMLSKLEPENLIANLATCYRKISNTLSSHLPQLDQWDTLNPLDTRSPVPFLHWVILSLCTQRSINDAVVSNIPWEASVISDWLGHYIRSTPQSDERDIFFRTPLFLAAQYGVSNVTAALLSVGADANDRDANGRSTLEVAAEGGHSLVVKQLLKAKADPDTKGSMHGSTPIQAAAENGHTDAVTILLEHIKELRSVCDMRSRDNKTARDLALEKGYEEIVRLLDEKTADFANRDFVEILGSEETPWEFDNTD